MEDAEADAAVVEGARRRTRHRVHEAPIRVAVDLPLPVERDVSGSMAGAEGGAEAILRRPHDEAADDGRDRPPVTVADRHVDAVDEGSRRSREADLAQVHAIEHGADGTRGELDASRGRAFDAAEGPLPHGLGHRCPPPAVTLPQTFLGAARTIIHRRERAPCVSRLRADL